MGRHCIEPTRDILTVERRDYFLQRPDIAHFFLSFSLGFHVIMFGGMVILLGLNFSFQWLKGEKFLMYPYLILNSCIRN